MYRVTAGDKERMYTRQGSTVFTRIDRYYAPAYHSHLVWNRIELDATFCRQVWDSDHIAVAASIGRIPEPSKPPPSIDTKLFTDKKVRARIIALLQDTYSALPTSQYGHSYPWEMFKASLRDLMLTETKARNKTRKTKTEIRMLQDEIQELADSAAEPSPEHVSGIKSLAK